MLTIHTSVEFERVITSSADTFLSHLLTFRAEQLFNGIDDDRWQWALMIVVEPPDALVAIEAEIGFPVLTNIVDGSRFGDPDFVPSWEWIEDHGGWFELVFILTDDGFAHVLFVKDCEGIDAELLTACRQACNWNNDLT